MPKFCSLSSVYIPGIPQRFVMCALAFIGTMVGWVMYYNGFNILYDIIIQHTNEPAIISTGFQEDRCDGPSTNTRTNSSNIYGTLSWPSGFHHRIMESLWLGYAASGVISGIAADMFGPKHVWGLGILLTSVTSFLLPQAAGVSLYALLVCLIFAGLGLGVMGSCSSTLVAHWAPVNARTIYVAIIESAQIFGLLIDFILHTQSVIWEQCLYASGISSIVWILVWYVLFYNRPEQHPHISPRELHYLQTRIIGLRQSNPPRVNNCKPLVPWNKILLSPPFMSLAMYNFASCWVQSLILYHMQEYISRALNVPIKVVPGTDATGVALVVALDSFLINAWISDKLLTTGFTTRTANRSFFLLFSSYISVILFLSIALLGCEKTFVVIMFFIMIHVQGMACASMYANVVDLSPRYAGLLRGILSAGRGLAIISCRQIKEEMVDSPDSYMSWKWFLYMSAAILIVFSSPYFCFGSGEIQTWNYHGHSEAVENTHIPSMTHSRATDSNIEQEDESSKTNKTIPAK